MAFFQDKGGNKENILNETEVEAKLLEWQSGRTASIFFSQTFEGC